MLVVRKGFCFSLVSYKVSVIALKPSVRRCPERPGVIEPNSCAVEQCAAVKYVFLSGVVVLWK